jgi:K+-transporting ATPase ATPase A chain
MTGNGWLQIAVFFLLVLACAKPLGIYIAAVMEGRRTWLSPIFAPCERLIYKICGVTADREQRWTGYAASLLAFSLMSGLLLYLLQRAQGLLPFNPRHFSGNVTPDLAFNTTWSFVTNTNWQAYTPESTLSYLVQMAGLTVHNFMSAASGSAIAMALTRVRAAVHPDNGNSGWTSHGQRCAFSFRSALS